MIPVKEVMTRNVITFREDTPIDEVATTLASKRITGAPVIGSDGHVTGIVSEVDVFSKKGKVARDIMSSHVITVSEDTGIDEAARALHKGGQDGRLVEPLGCSRFFRLDALDLQRVRAMGARARDAGEVLFVLQHGHPPRAGRSWALARCLAGCR